MSGKIQHVTEQRVFDQLLAGNELAIVKFTAAWCGPCQVIAPIFERLSSEAANVKFLEVDVDHSQSIAQKYTISSMPTFVSFHKQKEFKRFSGANPQALTAAVQELAALNPAASVSGPSGSPASGSSGSTASAGVAPEVEDYVPKGYELLNDTVVASSTEVLNVIQTKTDDSSAPPSKQLFDLATAPATPTAATVVSDADSQILIYVPFTNKCKVYSILLKFSADSKTPDGDAAQPPATVKVWANTTGTIAFEDAAAGDGALHEAAVGAPDANGWAEVQLRFVRFQSVGSLLIFLDGDDEDESTAIQKIALVGSKGDSLQHAKIEKVEG